MRIKILLAIAVAMVLTGCGDLFGPDKEGWKNSQKEEFLNILKTDKYMSICNQKPLYEQVKSSENSRLMTKLLVSYANNLANSCIDLKSFKASQRAKRKNEIDTYFETYLQEVKPSTIQMKLRAGQTIEQILQPYVPKTPQFEALVHKYQRLNSPDANITQSALKKIRLNIERTKLMKSDLGTNYTLVNIPEFKVRVIENGKTALKFPVIVGKRNMQTPIFSERMKYVEINPQWNVPDSIMRKSYVSKIKANPGWVAAKGMELHKETYDLRSPKVNPASVDWSKYPKDGKGYIPYKLVQVPSLKNGLGRVKFIFPNSHAVYMHDTQGRSLFKRKSRCFSHGCIRLGKPKELLTHVTKNYSNKSLETVQSWYDSMKTKHLILNKPLQVHTAYYTAYVDEAGALKLFPDVYGFDKSQKLTF
ncbi:MAG TPA: L,D-transpeptidase [Epsilonproteobacteria bacterium]|nr:L,D-transpeptidase [Campylobacterota bacterium]